MTKYTNQNPNLHLSMLHTQAYIFHTVRNRMVAENRLQEAVTLGYELIDLQEVIRRKEAQARGTN